MSKTGLSELLPRENVRGFASKAGASYTSGKLWPHGEWSFGWARSKGDGGKWHECPSQVSVAAEQRATEGGVWGFWPLDLSAPPNSCKWPRRGTKGMSGHGQQMIKAAGHLIQERWPRHRKTLGTITLPPMSTEARREVVEKWPLLTRELLTHLSRRLKRRGLPPVVLSVTEIQPRRLARSGEGSLHWHLLWLNVPARSGHWSFDPTDLSAWLDKLLRRHCPSYGGGYVNVDTRKVEGVVAAYMAKYMSKGKQMVAEAMQDWGYGLCPRTWWNMTKPCRDMVKAALLSGPRVGAKLEEVLELAFSYGVDECYAFLAPVMVEMDEGQRLMGWRGRFLPELDSMVRSVLGYGDIAVPG